MSSSLFFMLSNPVPNPEMQYYISDEKFRDFPAADQMEPLQDIGTKGKEFRIGPYSRPGKSDIDNRFDFAGARRHDDDPVA